MSNAAKLTSATDDLTLVAPYTSRITDATLSILTYAGHSQPNAPAVSSA
jgi:hypothetical protein